MDKERNSTTLNEDYSALDVVEILQKFRDLSLAGDSQEIFDKMEPLKAVFYKVLNEKKVDASLQELETLDHLESQFKDLYSKYKLEKKELYNEQERVKEENYAAKLQIIDELKELLGKVEDVNHTFPAFRQLQNRWKAIDAVPQSKVKDLISTYQYYVEQFYDYIKINNEFRDIDFKKNLQAKTLLCERAEALEKEPNVVVAFKELQKLHDEWKEIGPVAKEQREIIWDRFKSITTVINKKHQHFFEQLKDDQKKNLLAKTLLCEKAEEIANSIPTDSNEWNILSKRMDSLQAEWKNIGFAAKKENQKIYDRFRSACDTFYNSKRDYYSNFKLVMQENYSRKEQLCLKAESLMESSDWKKATDELIALQKEWKEIGPVARKQSDLVWKRFRAACDHFFEKKSQYFDKVDEKYEGNLALKLALIEEIKAYRIGDTKEDDIKAMRQFQTRWLEIGYVPIKDKERIQKEFNMVMDIHFADIRSLDSEKKLVKFKRMVTELKNSGKGERSIKMEREKLLLKYRKIEQDIATLQNNMGFFAKSKNADSMIEDIEKKISVAKDELVRIEEKINIIDNQFE